MKAREPLESQLFIAIVESLAIFKTASIELSFMADDKHPVPHTKASPLRAKKSLGLLTCVGFVALLFGPSTAVAQAPPPLGTVQQFAVLGAAGVTGQAGSGAVVNGDVGSNPTPAISNFPPSVVLPPFVLHLVIDAVTTQAQVDATLASANLLAQGPGTTLPAQLGLTTVVPGVYSFSSTADIAATQTLTLNGAGTYIFLIGSSITANVGSNVVLQNGASPCNVFWRAQISATLNGNNFPGTVIAHTGSVTVGDIVGPSQGMILTGRAVARVGAVTMPGDGGTTIGGCSGAGPGAPVPTLEPSAIALLAIALAAVALLVLRRNL